MTPEVQHQDYIGSAQSLGDSRLFRGTACQPYRGLEGCCVDELAPVQGELVSDEAESGMLLKVIPHPWPCS